MVSANALHEMSTFAQESSLLWREHATLLQATPKRREQGIVYTPSALVNTLISLVFDGLELTEFAAILDPSCGTGNFLVETYQRLAAHLVAAESRVELLRRSIFGCDIDAQAVEIAKRRLWQTALQNTGKWIPYAEFPHANFATGDALSLVPADDPRHLLPGTGWKLWATLIFPKPFDVVIGNPPYGKTRLTEAQRQYFAASLYGHANTYGLFLHLGVELLKPNGVLGYVIPASMLSGLYFQNLRRYLANECRFRAIVQFEKREGIFDSVLQEVMLLVLQRGANTAPYQVQVASVTKKEQIADWNSFVQSIHRVPVEEVLRQSAGYGMIHIPIQQGASAIYGKYEKHGVPLTDPAIGYVAKTGPIVWNRLKNHLCDKPGQDTRPLIWANNVSEYRFSADGNRDKKFGYLKCDERTAPLITHGPCLLVQRTTAKEQRRRIIAAFPLEWENATTSFFVENHLNLIVPIKGVKPLAPEIVLALLNSRLFDFIFRTFNGNTQVSATELNVMRFAAPETSIADEIVTLVRQLQRAEANDHSAQAVDLVTMLDRMVYDLYGLTPNEIQIIENHTRRSVG